MIAKKYKVVYSSSILYDVPSLKEEEGQIEIDQKNYTEQNIIRDLVGKLKPLASRATLIEL